MRRVQLTSDFRREAKLIGEAVQQIFSDITGLWQAPRPGRSFPRRSRKPAGKWRQEKTARLAGSAG